MWRPADQALLERLEDEICLERLWRHQAGSATMPSLRAAGMIAIVRRTQEGREVVLAAHQGRVEPLRHALYPRRHDERPPELHHHLALFEAAIADAVAEVNPGAARGADVRSIAAWLALGEEQRYLRGLGEAVAGADLPKAELERALAEAPFTRIDTLGKRAREGARARTLRAQTALASLAGVPDAVRHAGCGEALAKAAIARAERHRMAAVDEALAPIDEALSSAVDRGVGLSAAPDLCVEIHRAWVWSGEDEGVERFAADRTSSLLWEAYRAPGWDALRRMLTPLAPLVDKLASRIEADPSRIAYAGPCAQLLFFQADLEPDLAREAEILERALRVCPSHRNSRAHLARRLCEAACRLVDRSPRAPSLADVADAEAKIARAEKLYAASEKLPEARRKVEERRREIGGSPR